LDKKTRWSEVKDELRDDPRYEQLESSTLREEIFRMFLSSNVSEITGESKEQRREREKKERVEASLRERQKEVENQLSSHLKEREKEQEKVKKHEAVETFTNLLIDYIKSEDYSWREARKVLKKDNRIDLCEFLSREEKELLFNQHLQALHKKKKDKFREALSEIKTVDIFKAEWRDIRKIIKDDPRYFKFSSSDRKAEREFRDYVEDRLIQAKNEFKEFLKETKILTHKSKKLIDESDQHLTDIVQILQNDKRYLVLDCIEDERREILLNYVDELDRKGPPPPPTASEPQSSAQLSKKK
jgi:transcription elongation regulator 1